jgi:asparagine synthase (glutamine-hydrolysing)
MCGIAGIVTLREDRAGPDVDQVVRMVGALRHRGPDEFGVYRDRLAGLGHARLSIIDLATGQQPLSNESGTLWIVFSGEIFNYLELRSELETLGHRFRTRSDTEVIVHAYEQWGEAAFRRFNGQWSVALWDAADRALVLARDPFGVRPLYLCEHDGRLYFASEVKAIFAASRAIARAFDPIALDQLLTFWTSVAPSSGFLGVEELEPGSVRVLRRGGDRRSTSYVPGFPEHGVGGFPGSLDEAVEAVRGALGESTRLRMLRADVPVGCYLSGGLDSSLVAALGLAATGTPFATFSMRFCDPEYDETHYQRVMASHLGSEHHEILVGRDDIARVFPDVVAHTERPLLRTAPAPLFLMSERVHQAGIKVVLTGEGADEQFAGYDIFREAKVRRFWAKQPRSEWRFRLMERLYPYLERSPVRHRSMMRQFFGRDLGQGCTAMFGHQPRWRSTAALKRLLAPATREAIGDYDACAALRDSLPREFDRWSPLAQDQHLETRTLLSGYLLASQGDRMLMAHSVEGRFPFLDRQVTALAESLPDSYKLRVLDEKHVLKRAAAPLVPAAVLRRKKQPYRAPDALAFTSSAARDWIEEVASPAALESAGVFKPQVARQVIEKVVRRDGQSPYSNVDNMAVVGILSTQLVHHHFIRQYPGSAPIGSLTTLVDRITVPGR